MKLLNFDKNRKDRFLWSVSLVGDTIEITRRFDFTDRDANVGYATTVKAVVRNNPLKGSVTLSMNGRAYMSFSELEELAAIIEKAKEYLND